MRRLQTMRLLPLNEAFAALPRGCLLPPGLKRTRGERRVNSDFLTSQPYSGHSQRPCDSKVAEGKI